LKEVGPLLGLGICLVVPIQMLGSSLGDLPWILS